eukprot:GHUV01020073.1.p2 GENE.GHUV01020073.1~~GHUV01020073.1.p2  ORF type:complete len:144 (+),score=10.33 GHUV01020073.1:1485-1916(+)
MLAAEGMTRVESVGDSSYMIPIHKATYKVIMLLTCCAHATSTQMSDVRRDPGQRCCKFGGAALLHTSSSNSGSPWRQRDADSTCSSNDYDVESFCSLSGMFVLQCQQQIRCLSTQPFRGLGCMPPTHQGSIVCYQHIKTFASC